MKPPFLLVSLFDPGAGGEVALGMLDEIPGSHRVTLGADKNYDVKDFVKELPKVVEEIFGWMKTNLGPAI